MTNNWKKLFDGLVYTAIGKIGSILFGALSTFYLIRNYSVTDYGIYTLLMSTVTLASIITSSGLLNIIERYAPECYIKKDFNGLRKIFFSTVAARLLLGVLFIGIIFNNSLIKESLKLNALTDFKIEFIIIILSLLQVQLIGDVFLVSLLRQKFYNLAYCIFYLLEFAGLFFSVQYNKGLQGLFITLAICNLLLLLLFTIKSLGILFANKTTKTSQIPTKRILKYGASTFFVTLGYSLVDIWIDNFVINYYLGKEAVAHYGMANTLANMISSISPALLLLPIITSVSISVFTKTNSLSRLAFMYKFYNKIITLFALPMFTGFVLLSDKIVPLFFGEKYLPTIWLVNIVSIFSFVRMYTHPLKIIIKTLEKVHWLILGFFLSLYNLLMDIILVKSYGTRGVAIATGTTIILSYILMKIIVSREIKFKFPLHSTIKILISTIVMILFIISAKKYITNIFSLILLILMSGAIYFTIVSSLKPFNNREREILTKSLGKKSQVFKYV